MATPCRLPHTPFMTTGPPYIKRGTFWNTLAEDIKCNPDRFGKIAVALFRFSTVPGPFSTIFKTCLRIVCGADIPSTVEAGPRLRIAHGGSGVVIHPHVKLGADCTIYQNVTLGVSGRDQRAPTLKDGVYVAAGAVVVGGVTLGERSRVGANSVVRTNVPDFSTAVGSEGRIIVRERPDVDTALTVSKAARNVLATAPVPIQILFASKISEIDPDLASCRTRPGCEGGGFSLLAIAKIKLGRMPADPPLCGAVQVEGIIRKRFTTIRDGAFCLRVGLTSIR